MFISPYAHGSPSPTHSLWLFYLFSSLSLDRCTRKTYIPVFQTSRFRYLYLHAISPALLPLSVQRRFVLSSIQISRAPPHCMYTHTHTHSALFLQKIPWPTPHRPTITAVRARPIPQRTSQSISNPYLPPLTSMSMPTLPARVPLK